MLLLQGAQGPQGYPGPRGPSGDIVSSSMMDVIIVISKKLQILLLYVVYRSGQTDYIIFYKKHIYIYIYIYIYTHTHN